MSRVSSCWAALPVAATLLVSGAGCGDAERGAGSAIGAGKGDAISWWSEQLYNNAGLYGPTQPTTVYGATIDRDWGAGSPVTVRDGFAVRWFTTKQVLPDETLAFAYEIGPVDELRVCLAPNGTLLSSSGSVWGRAGFACQQVQAAPTAQQGTLTFAERRVDQHGYSLIVVEFVDHGGNARIKLAVSDAAQERAWRGKYWLGVVHQGGIHPEILDPIARDERADGIGDPVPVPCALTDATPTCDLSRDFGDDGPLWASRMDYYVGRWQRTFGPGRYRIVGTADDQLYLYAGASLAALARLPGEVSAPNGQARWELLVPTGQTREVVAVFVELTQTARFSVLSERLGDPEVICPANHYRMELFANRWLSGAPEEVRCVEQAGPNVALDWERASPFTRGWPADDFSVRLSGRFHFDGGAWRMNLLSDDGARLYVKRPNGSTALAMTPEQIGERFDGGYAALWQDKVFTLDGGEYEVIVEHAEIGGGANVKVARERLTQGTLCNVQLDAAGTPGAAICVYSDGNMSGFNASLGCYHLAERKLVCPPSHRILSGGCSNPTHLPATRYDTPAEMWTCR